MFNPLSMPRSGGALLRLSGTLALALSACTTGQAQEKPAPDMAQAVQEMQGLDGWRGYLDVHEGVKKPRELVGGPISIELTQDAGGVFVAMPGHRKRDPMVFGPSKMPRHYAGTPVITGVPPFLWKPAAGGGEETKPLTPFGDEHIVLPDGELSLEAMDATATDAAVTNDEVELHASWKDAQGNTYAVECCVELAAHGMEFPTFGGVATNVILHGNSGVGTPLMPTEFTYFAFWGFGEIDKNGETLDKPRLIHGMLTEYVREQDYRLADDRAITPERLQFHLMVAPFEPDPKRGVFTKAPVHTGFALPNGEEMPFWHVMFENLELESHRG